MCKSIYFRLLLYSCFFASRLCGSQSWQSLKGAVVQVSQLHREYIKNLNMTKEDRLCVSRIDYSKIIIESLEKFPSLVQRREQLCNESSSDDSSGSSYDERIVVVPEYSLLLDYVVNESSTKVSEKSYLSSAIGKVVACLDYLLTGSFYENSAYYYVGQKYKI